MGKRSHDLGSTRDSAFMAVNEGIALAANSMDEMHPDTMLFIALSGESETAILCGQLKSIEVDRLQALIDEVKRRAQAEGDGDKVLHVWR